MSRNTKICLKYIGNIIINKLFSVRFFLVIIILWLFRDAFVIRELRELCQHYNVNVVPVLTPFFMNNLEYIFVYGFCIIYFFSDVPFMNQWEMFYIARIGRLKWCICKIASIIAMAFIIIFLNFVLDIVTMIPYIEFNNEWDRLIMSLGNDMLEWSSNIFSYDIVNFYRPLEMVVHCILYGTLVTAMIGMSMFAICLASCREVAVIFGGVIACMPIVAANDFTIIRYVYYASPLNWISILTNRFASDLPNEGYVLTFLIAFIVVDVVVIILLMSKKDFVWCKEE